MALSSRRRDQTAGFGLESRWRRQPATSLGLLDATMVGIGGDDRCGIFVLTGLAADVAGPAVIVVACVALNALSTVASGGPETVLAPGNRYVVTVESDVADEVMNLLRG